MRAGEPVGVGAEYVEVGTALREIQDSRLYTSEFSTFEAYCQERREWGRAYVYRQIDAANVTASLMPIGTKPETENPLPAPHSESVARELVPVLHDDPEQVAEVWGEVVQEHGPEPTAVQVREHVQKRLIGPLG